MLAAIIMAPNYLALFFSLTVISTWNISTEKLDRCINSEGIFQSEMEGQGSQEIGKHDKNNVLWNFNCI